MLTSVNTRELRINSDLQDVVNRELRSTGEEFSATKRARKHEEHHTRYNGHLPGLNNDVRERDHDYLSQTRVIKTNDGKDIISVPVPMTIKSQLGNPTALAVGAFSTTLNSVAFFDGMTEHIGG
jgi:hypothetical protein